MRGCGRGRDREEGREREEKGRVREGGWDRGREARLRKELNAKKKEKEHVYDLVTSDLLSA